MVFLWIAFLAILLIENLIGSMWIVYVLWLDTKAFYLILASSLIWFIIWYWVKWIICKDKVDDSEIDF